MANPTQLSAAILSGTNDLNSVRAAANQNSPEALKAAAQQFEALMMNQILKSMREAAPKDDMFSSDQTRMYTSLLDQELSQHMAKRGVGFADMIVKQLSSKGVSPDSIQNGQDDAAQNPQITASIRSYKNMANASAKDQASYHLNNKTRSGAKSLKLTPDSKEAGVPKSAASSKGRGHVKAFQEAMMSHANEASEVTGIPAKFMVAQAALETGWGKKQIVEANGRKSHNLFGIKATGNWKGRTVSVPTTEYVNGKAVRKLEKFRAYDSYAESFKDYANLLKTNPRYKNVMNTRDASSFAHGLQRAGYATDPNYANKLRRIINSGNMV